MNEQPTDEVTIETALANAASLLRKAEDYVDPTRMGRLAELWISIAATLVQRERPEGPGLR